MRQACRQMSLFPTGEASLLPEGTHAHPRDAEHDRQLQQAMLDIREKFGKNAVLRAASLQEAATARQRNAQIGGHSA